MNDQPDSVERWLAEMRGKSQYVARQRARYWAERLEALIAAERERYAKLEAENARLRLQWEAAGYPTIHVGQDALKTADAIKVAIEACRGLDACQDAAALLERLAPFVEAAIAYCEAHGAREYDRMMAAYRALSPEETTKP